MMRHIKVCTFLINMVLAWPLFSQNMLDPEFLNHLSRGRLKIEHLEYLNSLSVRGDSLDYLLASYYLQYDDEANFFIHFKRSPTLFLRDSLAVGFASCFYLQHDSLRNERKRWFRELTADSVHGVLRSLISLVAIDRLKPRNIRLENYPNVLRDDIISFRKMAGKRPAVSALLSAVLPGMGKLYIGKYRIGFSTLLMNGMLMAQSYESVQRLGWKHPLSLFNMLLSSLFYLSNIYGSYRDTKYFRNEHLEQLYIDASNYYSVNHYPSLLPR